MEPLPSGIFITGTGTGVGKTVVTGALAWALGQSGKDVSLMKPVQTGTNLPGITDLDFVERVTEMSYASEDHCPYRFLHPLSPLVASRLEGRGISLEKIKTAFNKISAAHDLVIVEGAGGLLVPILENYLMSDLASYLGLSVVVVTRPDLGALNHTLLTVESAKSRGLEVLGIVINNFPAVPDLAQKTNPELLSGMTGLSILGVLPNDPGISVEEGRIGNLRENARLGLISDFGGSFDSDEFLSRLR